MTWSKTQAQQWYESNPWQCGFNYVPSTAVNSTEMWQNSTFNLEAVCRELARSAEIGFNCCRVFLPFIVWEAQHSAFIEHFDRFLQIAESNRIRVLPILFDDCSFSGKEPYLGKQNDPIPGVHNSGWTASPGAALARNRDAFPRLKSYVLDIVRRFAADSRILGWDVYNEPGNTEQAELSMPLLQSAFAWVREAEPLQPITAGIWNPALHDINRFMLDQSDIITFHCYENIDEVRKQVGQLRHEGRPLLCTEWLRRDKQNLFETHLEYFKREHIGAMFWGLVNGRTQTHFPWGSPENAPAPTVWFHDLLDQNGAPHREQEVNLIRKIITETGD